jgi:hypothetical protein
MDYSADGYVNEPARYPALRVTNLKAEGEQVTDTYRNMVINRVNGTVNLCFEEAAAETIFMEQATARP